MEFEVLKRSHIKRSIVIGVVVVFIISAIILNFTRAKYRSVSSVPIINSEINYKVPDLNMVSLYVANEEGVYEEADTIPSSGYTLNIEQSYCGRSNIGEVVKDDTVSIVYENGSISVNNITKKGTKCYLYFDAKEENLAAKTILAGKNIDDSRSGAITGTLTTNTTGTVYSVADDWGTSYVYAGAPTDNWVQFGGFYWRIIRINGDGSIRMIYAGESTIEKNEDDQIQEGSYNSSDNDNAYVGYMYGSIGASSYASTHANNTDSTIKGILDSWYKTNIVDKGHSDKVSTEAGFCNDRKTQSGVMSGYGTLGYGTNATTYAPLGRLMSNGSYKSSQTPSLKCSQIGNDMFTVSGSSKGNHKLTYPIGLITSDEVVLAGGFGGSSNSSYYLFTDQDYWTITPHSTTTKSFINGVFMVWENGRLGGGDMAFAWGVRPVINLSSDVQITGSGTSTDPYTVVEA